MEKRRRIGGAGGVQGALAVLFWSAVVAAAQVTPPSSLGEIVVIGDELAAGYGLAAHEMYPAILLRELKRENLRYQVRSASAPGDTTDVGARRVPVVLQVPELRWVVLALGRNDAKGKISLDAMRGALTATIEGFAGKGIKVLLCGFPQPPEDDLAYAAGFHSLYLELAGAYRLPLVTNLLAGVQGVAAMNLNDGKHPNREGQKRIAQNILDVLLPRLRTASTNQAPAVPAAPDRAVPEGTVAPPLQF